MGGEGSVPVQKWLLPEGASGPNHRAAHLAPRTWLAARAEESVAAASPQAVPALNQIGAVVKQCKSPLKEAEPLAGLPARHAQSVLSGGRWAWFPGCDRPELVQVLRYNDEPFAPRQEGMHGPTRDGTLRV